MCGTSPSGAGKKWRKRSGRRDRTRLTLEPFTLILLVVCKREREGREGKGGKEGWLEEGREGRREGGRKEGRVCLCT